MSSCQRPVVEGTIVEKKTLEDLIASSRDQFHLIDVREPAEVAATGLIESAKNIPRSLSITATLSLSLPFVSRCRL